MAWLALVGTGMKFVLDHQTRAGAPSRPPSRWPAGSRLAVATGRPTLLLFVHPRCPCTRATLFELERVQARTRGALNAAVAFVVPPGEDAAWANGELWGKASAIPSVRVDTDLGGTEARRFGSTTSGQVLLYDGTGRLRFAGGITPGRGHAGDNAGSDAIVAFARGESEARSATPVFGCALASPHSTIEGRDSECPR